MYRRVAYQVVTDDDEEKLVQKVNALLDDGWELQGGISCALSEGDDFRYTIFAQAMTRLLSPAEQVEAAQKKKVKAK